MIDPNLSKSEVSLADLRQLRERAQGLLAHVVADLAPFAKEDGTFLRKPDSRVVDNDINVTTTCSCLMALALTNSFHEFYKERKVKNPATIFRTLVTAPWMSSGLTANNPFTTVLVLRTFGFLHGEQLFSSENGTVSQKEEIKYWKLNLGIDAPRKLAEKLKKRADLASEFLWLGLTDNTRDDLLKETSGKQQNLSPKLTAVLALELRRIIQSGWIYEAKRFNKASKNTRNELDKKPTGYTLAEINHQLLVDQFPNEFAKPAPVSLGAIAAQMAANPFNFSINEYPPSVAVAYWFVDGVDRAKVTLPADRWTTLCKWATQEFNHERSLVVAEHDAMMDPVALGMAACLCARLKNISADARLGSAKQHLAMLPSLVELEHSICELFAQQTKTGIFHKYFPMFHYQEAGSNFCFTFELLEAVLYEFGRKDNKLLDNPGVIAGLHKAVNWCEQNRLKYGDGAPDFTGWNSGGDLNTLRKNQPESWATAVVHMFLWELTNRLSQRIQQLILKKYKATIPVQKSNSPKEPPPPTALNGLLDIEILLKSKSMNLSEILQAQIIAKYSVQTEQTLRRKPLKEPLSALLFGPPGTSKTEVTKAVATDMGWPLLEITPSDFVKGTLANVYLQADEIFEDLMDLSGVVVFFDEMDALVQTRDSNVQLDIASQFLTTTMLPKLTKLHDQARIVFFMATNFQDRFDPAIKRTGRFDLLLCMGPPKLNEKLERLHRVYFLDKATDQTSLAGKLIGDYLHDRPDLLDQLALYTFGEFKAFIRSIGKSTDIGDKLTKIKKDKFVSRFVENSGYVLLKIKDLDPLLKLGIKWDRISDLDSKQFSIRDLGAKEEQPTQIIRYFCDRKESKEQ